MRRAMALRPKATILFATETGKSETLAQNLGHLFKCAFNTQVRGREYVGWLEAHHGLHQALRLGFGNSRSNPMGLLPIPGIGLECMIWSMALQ